MKAVSAAEPSVWAQLMSRGTFRKRNHFVPRTAAVRSSTQSSGARTASVDELVCRLDFAAIATPSPGSGRSDRATPRPVDVRARHRPRVPRDRRVGARPRDVPHRVQLAEDKATVPDRERVPIHRAHRWAGPRGCPRRRTARRGTGSRTTGRAPAGARRRRPPSAPPRRSARSAAPGSRGGRSGCRGS